MAALPGDLSQNLLANCISLYPQSITGNTTGISLSTATIGGDVLSCRATIGQVTSLTSLAVTFQSSPDGSTWTDMTLGNGAAATITFTAANQTGIVATFPANGTLSQYVRGNAVLTGTSANVTAEIVGALRLGTGTPYVNAPYSGAQ